MGSLNYTAARHMLEEEFTAAEQSLLDGRRPAMSNKVREACDVAFASNAQAYREVMLGCTFARILDINVNILHPYVEQSENAFSGRSLDERVVNPFLHSKRIPCSKGPYLSVFRRSVKYDESTRDGLRDKSGYDALLTVLLHVHDADREQALSLLRYELHKFAELRESSNIPLAAIHRISLDQYDSLLSGLLATPSGGRFPMLIAAAMFETIKRYFGLDWEVLYQGINVSDAASGAGGDITITSDDTIVLAVEVTERVVDRARVVSTFNTKIAPASIADYLFFLSGSDATAEARDQAARYFAQGHEVNFVNIKDWILMCLATTGSRGRTLFTSNLIAMLEECDAPQAMRVAWNDQVNALTSGQ